jgi:hypothetical protein
MKYELFQPARGSLFHILSNICSKYNLTQHNVNIRGTLKIISDSYKIKMMG